MSDIFYWCMDVVRKTFGGLARGLVRGKWNGQWTRKSGIKKKEEGRCVNTERRKQRDKCRKEDEPFWIGLSGTGVVLPLCQWLTGGMGNGQRLVAPRIGWLAGSKIGFQFLLRKQKLFGRHRRQQQSKADNKIGNKIGNYFTLSEYECGMSGIRVHTARWCFLVVFVRFFD